MGDDSDYVDDSESAMPSIGIKQEGELEEKSVEEATSPSRKRKRKSRIIYKDPSIDKLPSFARKTEAGGYAHTNKSKEKISKANSGNVPWNKGKKRSSADKARIKAGVQAHNRAIKLEKLKRLGMTEEEYDQKKKQIKYLRERVRRTNLANNKHEKAKAQKELQKAIDATTDTAPKTVKLKKAPKSKAGKAKATATAPPPPIVIPRNQTEEEVFKADFSWTPLDVWNDGKTFDKACPSGGPGGLICCQECNKLYSSYLDKTLKEMEVQRTDKVGGELKELLTFLDKEKSGLERAANFARKKAPPKPRINPTGVRRTATSKQISQEAITFDEWNITSTIDIVAPTQTAII